MPAIPMRFCVICKDLRPAPNVNGVDMFLASGHSYGPVRHLQRNLGRKQRPKEWQTSADASTAKAA